MSKKTPRKKQFISDKIADSFTVKPRPDVEDDLVYNTKPSTVTKDDLDSDNDGEATLSSFRKQNVALLNDLSERYSGEVSSRKSEEYQQSESDDDSLQLEASRENDIRLYSSNESDDPKGTNDEGESDGEEKSEDDSEVGDGDDFDMSHVNEKESNNFEHMTHVNESEEASKGKCVKNQLLIWENLLEMRIALQKCLVSSNKMPLTETFNQFKKEDESFVNLANKTKSSVTSLLHKLLDLQTNLLSQYPETKNILSAEIETTTNDSDEEILSDLDDVPEESKVKITKSPKKRKITDISKDLSERHNKYLKYRNSTIQKWYDKTRVAIINSKAKNSATSIMSQIEFLLNDKERLIKRTQLKRSNYDIIGMSNQSKDTSIDGERNEDEYCCDIFDDDDFYHQLLRELIEYKSSDISDPIQLSRQWIALQQMRSKMKRKIDTRATKGRRIRYAVHSKLVNFMAPKKNTEWTDESKDELFGSLFGQQYEAN